MCGFLVAALRVGLGLFGTRRRATGELWQCTDENWPVPGRGSCPHVLTFMADENTAAAGKLKKLGQRVREGWAKNNPIPDQSFDTIRKAVREEWQREQTQKRGKSSPAPGKSREQNPPEPER